MQFPSENVLTYDDEFDYAMLHSFADVVGTNFAKSAIIVNTLGAMQSIEFDMRKAVQALSALKHIRKLTFECACLMHSTRTVDMELLERLTLTSLDNLQRLELRDVNNGTDWAFLRKDWALRLRSLSVKANGIFYEVGLFACRPACPEIDASGQVELLEYCTDFVHIENGKSKKLTIKGWLITSEFLQRITAYYGEFT